MKAVNLLDLGERTRSEGSCCNGVFLPGFGFLLYIAEEVEAIGQLNQQTAGINLMCDQLLVRCNRSHNPRIASLNELDYEAAMSALWLAISPARVKGASD
jgi:hypothetical protein